MADSWLNVMKQETERLEIEIEGLQGEIRFRTETKEAWDTILRNAGKESLAACQAFAQTEAERLNGEIEAIQDKIQHHIQTREAWESISRHTGRQRRVYQSVTYVRGEDVQWHLHRLDAEMDALQEEIHLDEEIKSAWKTILGDTVSETQAACQELANSETTRLDGEIEAAQGKICRHLETRGAWDTILRNTASESRIYQGATYVRGWDGQWHRQQTEAVASYEIEDSKGDSVWQTLLNTCEQTLLNAQKRVALPTHGKEQLQSLGLR